MKEYTLTQIKLFASAIDEERRDKMLMDLSVIRVAHHADKDGINSFEAQVKGKPTPKALATNEIPEEWFD